MPACNRISGWKPHLHGTFVVCSHLQRARPLQLRFPFEGEALDSNNFRPIYLAETPTFMAMARDASEITPFYHPRVI